jgi:hypothetical protein
LAAQKEGAGFHMISVMEVTMARKKSARAAEDRLLGLLEDLISEAGDKGIIGFSKHIGMQLTTDDMGLSWWPRFLAHYTGINGVNEDRVANDLATFPPIVQRLAELRIDRSRRN